MVAHDFIVKDKNMQLNYKLRFDEIYCEIVTLPAPSLFDLSTSKYLITSDAFYKYQGQAQASEPEPEPPLDPYRQSVYGWELDELANQWHQEDTSQYTGGSSFDPWPYTNLGQKPKLGGVRVSHRLYIHVHTHSSCRCSHSFTVLSMFSFISFS